MKFRNVSPLGDLEVPILGRVVKAGEVFEVPADLGVGFYQQPAVWEFDGDKKERAEIEALIAPDTAQVVEGIVEPSGTDGGEA